MIDESRLVVLERRWREILEQGQTIAPDEFCAEEGCPELAHELKSIIENQTIIEHKPAEVRTARGTKADTEESGRRPLSDLSAQETLDIPSSIRNNSAFEESEQVQHGTQSRYGRMQFVAEGGLGQVFRATDSALNRDVALKFIRPEHADNEDLHQRFLAETEITAQLEHPGVVPLYGFGRTLDGRIFYAMRFIQGETLNEAIERFHEPKSSDAKASDQKATRKLKADSVEFRRLLGRLVSVCYTIAYAHDRGVIHRDLKPQNIMLGKFDETLVVDWGLAMRVGRPIDSPEMSVHLPSASQGSNTSSSASGSGTPAYMSPEQADPDNKFVDQSSDIFSLGAILYKILTGEPPFQGRTQREVMGKARANEFSKPSLAIKGIPKALEAICLKTMSLSPSDRYPRARDLAADIERFLSDAPVSACKDPWLERVSRWARHHRGGSLTIVGLVAVVAIFGVLLSMFQARQQAETMRLHENSLQASASFAARGIAEEIENRWLILKKAALDPSLPDLIAKAAEGKKTRDDQDAWKKDVPAEPRRQLNTYMTHVWNSMKDKTQAATLFLLDSEGFVIGQKARDDQALKTIIGKDLSERDYYDDPRTDDKEITRRPLRSSLYQSKRDKKQKIAFTVPVYSGPRGQEKIIGLLGMSVDPGDFKFLTELPHGQIAVLVDMREDTEKRAGRIVQYGHPEETTGGTPKDLPAARLALDAFYIGDAELELLRSRQQATAKHALPLLTHTHHDPLAKTVVSLAAYEPVIIDNHLCDLDEEDSRVDTGLMIIIQESP